MHRTGSPIYPAMLALLVWAHGLCQQIEIALDGCQQIVEIMRDAASKLTDRL